MSKMMRASTLVLITMFLTACAEKGLLRLEGALEISVWGGVPQSFASVGEEPEVQLGTVIAQDTQVAWFAIENMGQAPMEISATRFDSDVTVGGEWLEPVRWERDASGAHLPLALPVTLPVRGSLVFGIPFQAFLPADASARLVVAGSGGAEVAARVRATPTYDASSSLTWKIAERHEVDVHCDAEGCENPDGSIRMGTAQADEWTEFSVILENDTECRLLQGQDPCTLCSVTLGNGTGLAPQLIVDTVDAEWELIGSVQSLTLTSNESCGGSQAWEGSVRVRPSRGGWHGVTMETPIRGAFEDTLVLDLAVEGMMPDPTDVVDPVDPEPTPIVKQVQVLIDGTLGPAADTCTAGICQWNNGSAVAMGSAAVGTTQSEMIRVVNATECPEDRDCADCQVTLGSASQAALSLAATDNNATWTLSGENGVLVLGAPRADCQAQASSATFEARAEGTLASTSEANFEILTDVAATTRVMGTLQASFVETDAPRIEVEILGDVINADDARCQSGTCAVSGLSAGVVLPGSTTTVPFTIRNLASCASTACDACELNLAPNGQGITLSTGSGVTGSLSSVATSIAQASASCNEDGEWQGVLELSGAQAGVFDATLRIPSNDAGASLITIGFGVEFADQPIAIADFAPCVEDMGGSSRCTVDSVVDPMEPVVLKGDESFDPMGRDLTRYEWVIAQAPNGSQHQVGEVLNSCTVSSYRDCLTYEMLADVPGEYELCLEVRNDAGATSSRTTNSCASWFVYPSSDIHIQLSWPEGTGRDLDLHLNNLSISDRVCNPDASCNFRNCKQDSSSVQWFTEDTAGNGANPRLDVDSLSGSQHENINIDSPRDGSYRVYVHYYASSSSLNGNVDGLVTVWIRGVEVFGTTMAQLKENDVWRVGDVMWYGDEAVFVPYSASDKVGSEMGVSAGNDAPTYWCTSSRGGWEWAP